MALCGVGLLLAALLRPLPRTLGFLGIGAVMVFHYTYIINQALAIQIVLYVTGAASFIRNGGHVSRHGGAGCASRPASSDALVVRLPGRSCLPAPLVRSSPARPSPRLTRRASALPLPPVTPTLKERLPFMMTDHHILHYTVTIACCIHLHNLLRLQGVGGGA
jgi:hypothetical protein